MKKQYLYGSLGLLSLLGFIGVFTEERSFLAFFAFTVDFQYFFLPSDEMAEMQLTRAARPWICDRDAGHGGGHPGDLVPGRYARTGYGRRLCRRMGGVRGDVRHDDGSARIPGKLGGWIVIRNRMKEHRARLGLKQEDLAKLVGVRRETIGNLEKGRYNPRWCWPGIFPRCSGSPIEEVFTVEPD